MTKQAELETRRETPLIAASVEADNMIRLAISEKLDVDKLERLIAMRDRENERRARGEFFRALTELQAVMPAIPKRRAVTRQGGGLLYKFANLDDITEALRPLEKAHGFAHRFEFAPSDAGCGVTCVVTHSAGHSERTTVTVPPTKGQNTNAAQDNGIQMAYGMRYALLGAYGITTADEDTDGRTGPTAPKGDPLTLADGKELAALGKAKKLTTAQVSEIACEAAGVADMTEITRASLPKIREAIERYMEFGE